VLRARSPALGMHAQRPLARAVCRRPPAAPSATQPQPPRSPPHPPPPPRTPTAAAPAPHARRAPRRGPRAAAAAEPGRAPDDGRARIPGPAALADLAARLALLLGRATPGAPAAAPAAAGSGQQALEGALKAELGAWAASVASGHAADNAPGTPPAAAAPRRAPSPPAASNEGQWAAATATLVTSLAALPSRDSRALATAWADVLAGGELSPSHDGAVELTGPSRDAALAGVLAAVLRRLPLAAGAAHAAAVAWQLPPPRAARVARTLMVLFEAEHAASRRAGHPAWTSAPGAAAPAQRLGAPAWLAMLGELSLPRPALAAAPPALRLLCAAASALDGDALPTFMAVAGAAAAAEAAETPTAAAIVAGGAVVGVPAAGAPPEEAALQLLYSCMAAARDAGGLQLLLRRLARQLPPLHARAMQAALGHRVTPETGEALAAAAAGGAATSPATAGWPAEEDLPIRDEDTAAAAAFADALEAERRPSAGGAAESAALALRLLAGPAHELRTVRLMLPALGRAFARSGGPEAAAFAAATAAGLPALPADRAALGLVLLQPVLAAAGALPRAALAVAAAHGADGAARAVEREWFDAEAAEAAGWAAAVSREAVHDVLLALEDARP
jgi:hypothetical protein